MDANRFFSVSYDLATNFKVRELVMRQAKRGATRMECIGRWVELLSLLYEKDGSIQLDDEVSTEVVCQSLDLRRDQLFDFMDDAAASGLINKDIWKKLRSVENKGVYEEIAYKDTRKKAGQKSSQTKKVTRKP